MDTLGNDESIEVMATEDNGSQMWAQVINDSEFSEMMRQLNSLSERSVKTSTVGNQLKTVCEVVTDGDDRGSDGSPVPTRPALIRLAFARTPSPTAPHSSVGHTSGQSLDSISGSDVQQIDPDLATSDVQYVNANHMTPETHITTQLANDLDNSLEPSDHPMRPHKRPNVSLERTVGLQNGKPTEMVKHSEPIRTRSVIKRMRLETISESIDESNGVDTNGSAVLSATLASTFLKRITDCTKNYTIFEALNESNGLKVDALSPKPMFPSFTDYRQVFESSDGKKNVTDSTSAATVGAHTSGQSLDSIHGSDVQQIDQDLATSDVQSVTCDHMTRVTLITTQSADDFYNCFMSVDPQMLPQIRIKVVVNNNFITYSMTRSQKFARI